MFYKEFQLNNFPKIDLNKLKGECLYTYGEIKEETGTVKSYWINDLFYTKEIISNLFQFNILPDWVGYIEIAGIGAPPHIDDHKTGLNLIIDDADSTTCFWKKNEEEYHELIDTLHTENTSKYYDINKCIKIGEFKAKPQSAWLYNLREIHSVHRPNDNNIRKFISIRWNEDFDTISKSIIIL